MDTTTETRGERSIPADRLAALYEAERENARLRSVVDAAREARRFHFHYAPTNERLREALDALEPAS